MRVPKQEIIDALDNSIAHWERMRDGKGYEGEEPYSKHCSLCDIFCCYKPLTRRHNKYYWDTCVGCPIAMHTGHDSCRNSPYDAAETAFSIMANPSKPTKRFQKAAQKMIDFLKERKAEQ